MAEDFSQAGPHVASAFVNVSSVVDQSTAATIIMRLVRAGIVSTKEGSRLRAERISRGQCSILAGWCLTHNVEEGFGHYLKENPGASTD
jgi:hypothetical protein